MPNIPSENAPEQKPTGDEKSGQTRDNKPNSPSSDFAALINAIKIEGAAYRREEQREDRGKKFREWITIGLLCATVIAIGWQVYEMIHVYGPIHDQAVAAGEQAAASDKAANAAIRAADATTKAADAAVKQSEIATKQAEASDRAAAQAQRAWVGPRDARLESKPILGQKNKVIIEYQNTGKEPAIGFVFGGFPFVITTEEDANGTAIQKMLANMKQCVETKAAMLAGVVFPTSGFTAGNLGTLIDEKLIDQDLLDSKKMLIIQGCFAYIASNVVRHSAFCYFFKADQTDIAHLNICQSGNYAD
jgi:hypothetical protein